MTKQELIEHIDESIRTEESASALYLKHMDAIVMRSGCPADQVAAMKDIIESLIAANKAHKARLQELRERVMEDPSDVY